MICSFTFSKESIVCYGFIKYLRENRKHTLGKNIFIHLIIHKPFIFNIYVLSSDSFTCSLIKD